MPRFAANLTLLYNEYDFLDRFAAAAQDGFRGVEFLFPYAFDALALSRCLQDNGLEQVLFPQLYMDQHSPESTKHTWLDANL